MCPTEDLQAATTAALEANNDIINFKKFLDGYEC